MGASAAAEEWIPVKIVQAKLGMADYLFVNTDAVSAEAPLYDVAIKRKTIGNLLGDSRHGNQLRQTLRLRRTGLQIIQTL